MSQFRKILVPFENPAMLEQALEPAFTLAAALSADLVLARVKPWHSRKRRKHDGERIYTELRGLLPRLQRRSTRVHLETLYGPMEKTVRRYADEEGIDLILLPNRGRLPLHQEPLRDPAAAPTLLLQQRR